MQGLLKVAFFIIYCLAWGILISIGFWIGSKGTKRADLWLASRSKKADAAFNRALAEMEKAGGV